jgi:glycosyltransferase involved in cell wall biosynthesis
LRILLLNQFYPPDTAATGQLLADLANELVLRGHEPHVLCSMRSYDTMIRKYPQHHTHNQITIHRVRATGFGRSNLLGRCCDYLSFYVLAMQKAIFLPRMDVCLSLTTPPYIGLVGSVLQSLRKTKLILWTMDLYPEVPVAYGVIRQGSLVHRLLTNKARHLYKHASCIISLGEVMTDRLCEAGADRNKIITVHNWVPEEAVTPLPRERSSFRHKWLISKENFALMYSGNMGIGHELKTIVLGYERFRVTFANEASATRLIFVGKGKMRQPLEDYVNSLHLHHVAFYDPVPLKQLGECLSAGDIHFVTQKPGTEGIIVPSKIYGIMAAGRPTIFIGPERCESAYIIRDGGIGIIIKPGDIDGLATTIKAFIDDPLMRDNMGRRAREYYETHFGRSKSVNQIAELIERNLN